MKIPRLILACAAVSVSLQVFAADPSLFPYLGGSLQTSQVNQLYEAGYNADMIPSGEKYTGPGFQVEGGCAGSWWTAYLGYRQDFANDKQSRDLYELNNMSYGWRVRNSWTAEHVLIGVRLHVSDNVGNPIEPAFGAAVTCGWARAGYEYEHREALSGWILTERSHRNYGPAIGWLAEAGAKIHTHWVLDFWALARIEILNMKEDPKNIYDSYISNHIQGALSVGAAYAFRRHPL